MIVHLGIGLKRRARVQHPRCWPVVLALAIAIPGRPAAAQSVAVQADATVNVGYNQTTRSTTVVDPKADPADIPKRSTDSVFTELRPGISVESGSPRLSWRASYLFAGTLNFEGGAPSYSNQATAAAIADLTPLSVLTVSSVVAQGGTSFLQSQQAADQGKAEIRAPGNPDLISATLAESLAWQAGRHLQVQQGLTGSVSAPRDDLGNGNTALIATLSLERLYERDTLGAELRGNVSRLNPLRTDLEPYLSYTSAILGRWNHDFSVGWNGLVAAGLEQLFTDTGNRPLAFLPTGSATLRYSTNGVVGGLELTHGTATNLQVGTVSLADQITARGVITIDEHEARVLSFSAGFLHNEPLGEVAAQVAAGTGNAVQGDLGFTTAITRNVLASVRYSLAYQYGQDAVLPKDDDAAPRTGFGPTLAHIFFIGVTASYSNTKQIKRPFPARGQRVDGSDGQGFSVVPDEEVVPDAPSRDRHQTP